MNNTLSISDAEWEVMKVIWKKDKITANEIIDELSKNIDWKANTIKTLINRLLKKGVISFQKNGKEYLYYSVASEEECVKAESETFLKKVFNGSVNSMILNFVKSEKLSEKDIEELKQILNKAEN